MGLTVESLTSPMKTLPGYSARPSAMNLKLREATQFATQHLVNKRRLGEYVKLRNAVQWHPGAGGPPSNSVVCWP